MKPLACVALSILLGCGTRAAAPRPSQPPPGCDLDAFNLLAGPTGPERFAQVAGQLYRGGQPTTAHLAALRALGVGTIVDLREEDATTRQSEEAAARALGLSFVSLPFRGTREPDEGLLHLIVDAMADTRHGAVYVHCRAGRDRTSLAVALYRVWKERWEPARAWQHEAKDFGHRGWVFLRALGRVFARLTTPAAA